MFRSLVLLFLLTGTASADIVNFQNGTATFSQGLEDGLGPYSPDEAVNGVSGAAPGDGWAIGEFNNGPLEDFTNSQAAVWETTLDLDAPGIRFELEMVNLLGNFRFSYTTDDRSQYADGVDNGGMVDANWVPLLNGIASGPPSITYTTQNNGNILATNYPNAVVGGTLTVDYLTPLDGVTGFRLDVIEDPSLPFHGPGLEPQNGNFVLVEMTASTIPEPNSLPILGSVSVFCLLRRRGRKR